MFQPPLPRARILIVDDDHTALSALGDMVREHGLEPVLAGNWSEALRSFRDEQPDLVLLDVMMPTVDGYKLAHMLKTESTRFVPVILLTALDDATSRRRGMASGADDFLAKPVDPVELQVRLTSLLRIKLLTDELETANSKLAELAITDPLTSLSNRRQLSLQIEREFARSRRYNHPLAALMIDIDHFKRVNDELGHPVGDRVLILVADVLKRVTREIDIVGRYGGEEFLLLAPETTHAHARVVAERVRSQVRTASAAAADLPAVTVSVGYATTEAVTVGTAEELVRAADQALYEAKRLGRNRCVG